MRTYSMSKSTSANPVSDDITLAHINTTTTHNIRLVRNLSTDKYNNVHRYHPVSVHRRDTIKL